MSDMQRVRSATPAPSWSPQQQGGGTWSQQQQGGGTWPHQQQGGGTWPHQQQDADPSRAVLQAAGAWLGWAWQQYGRASLALAAQAVLVLVLLYVLAHIVARLRGRK